MFFRLLVLFFTVAASVLLVWAVVGSWKNESYLTNNYLISFQLTGLNLSSIFENTSLLNKRELSGNSIADDLASLVAPSESVIDVVPADKPLKTKLTPTKTYNEKRIDIGGLTGLLSLVPTNIAGITLAAGDVLGSSASSGATTANNPLNAITSAVAGNSQIASALSQFSVPTSNIQSALANANTASLLSEAQAFISTASIPDSVASLVSQITGDLSGALESIIENAKPSDLGLSDMYSVGFYGYCKGELTGNVSSKGDELGVLGKQFRNNNVNYTYCSSPVFGYKLDPLTLIKHEMLGQIEDYGKGLSNLTAGLADSFIADLLGVVSSLSYDNLGLPGNLQQDLGLLHTATIAGFSLLFAGACLALISVVFQLIGLFCLPENACLSCCNFFLMLLVTIVIVVGSALTTGVFLYVRRIVNANLDSYGVRTFLSQQFYAFAWCAAVSALIVVVLSIVGYCCGCFHHRKTAPLRSHPLRYDHKV